MPKSHRFLAIMLVLLSFALASCSTVRWDKSGGSQGEYLKDRFNCIKQSQQHYSDAFANETGAVASGGVTTNLSLFKACMLSFGYTFNSDGRFGPPDGQGMRRASTYF